MKPTAPTAPLLWPVIVHSVWSSVATGPVSVSVPEVPVSSSIPVNDVTPVAELEARLTLTAAASDEKSSESELGDPASTGPPSTDAIEPPVSSLNTSLAFPPTSFSIDVKLVASSLPLLAPVTCHSDAPSGPLSVSEPTPPSIWPDSEPPGASAKVSAPPAPVRFSMLLKRKPASTDPKLAAVTRNVLPTLRPTIVSAELLPMSVLTFVKPATSVALEVARFAVTAVVRLE